MADKRLQLPLSVAQIVIKYSLDSQPCENVLYCAHQHRDITAGPYLDSPMDIDSANWVADKVTEWLGASWSPFAHGLAYATEVDVIWNTVVGAGPLHGIVHQGDGYPIQGANDAAPLPNNASVAIEWRTAVLGRSFHGRTYAVGLNAGQVDSAAPNVLKSAAISDVPAAFDDLRVRLTAARFTTLGIDDDVNDRYPLVVVSYVTGGVDRSPAVRTVIEKATISDPYIDSMRRRLPGHNRHGRRS